MHKVKFHRYCNLDIENKNNDKIYNYIINYCKNLSSKRRKGLQKISFKKEKVLDFYYHINGKTYLSDYYVMSVWGRYKKTNRAYQFKVYDKDLI